MKLKNCLILCVAAITLTTIAQPSPPPRPALPPPAPAPAAPPATDAAKGANPAAVKLGRNDPCYCGSGLKFKKCHGR